MDEHVLGTEESVAKAWFDAALPEVPAEVGELIVRRWTNLRAA